MNDFLTIADKYFCRSLPILAAKIMNCWRQSHSSTVDDHLHCASAHFEWAALGFPGKNLAASWSKTPLMLLNRYNCSQDEIAAVCWRYIFDDWLQKKYHELLIDPSNSGFLDNSQPGMAQPQMFTPTSSWEVCLVIDGRWTQQQGWWWDHRETPMPLLVHSCWWANDDCFSIYFSRSFWHMSQSWCVSWLFMKQESKLQAWWSQVRKHPRNRLRKHVAANQNSPQECHLSPDSRHAARNANGRVLKNILEFVIHCRIILKLIEATAVSFVQWQHVQTEKTLIGNMFGIYDKLRPLAEVRHSPV